MQKPDISTAMSSNKWNMDQSLHVGIETFIIWVDEMWRISSKRPPWEEKHYYYLYFPWNLKYIYRIYWIIVAYFWGVGKRNVFARLLPVFCWFKLNINFHLPFLSLYIYYPQTRVEKLMSPSYEKIKIIIKIKSSYFLF